MDFIYQGCMADEKFCFERKFINSTFPFENKNYLNK